MVSSSSSTRADVGAGTGKMGPKVLVIEAALSAPLTRHLGLLVLVVALLQLLMVIDFACHNFVVIRSRRSVIALRSPVIAHIVAPISIPVMPASRRVSRLLPAVIFEDKLILYWSLEPVVFNGFACRLLQRISDEAGLFRTL